MFERLIFPTIMVGLAAYLICGIPFGLLIAKAFGTDVRKSGSGNIGATNVGRTVGKAAAALTLLCDVGKGFVCTASARALISWLSGCDPELLSTSLPGGAAVTIVFLSCILGHVYSPYLGLHGGKGISVGFGASLGLNPIISLVLLLVFLLAAIPSKYVSLGSVCADISLPIACIFLGFSVQSLIPVILACIVVLWAHRENIKALIKGTERKFSFHKSQKEQ